MKTISIDIETYSSVNLGKSGVYRYAESADFEILLFAYSIDLCPVRIIDIACGEKIPEEILAALKNPKITKWAFNASFERICLSRMLGLPKGTYLDPASWKCSMVWSAYMGLPLSLEGAGAVLGLEKQKMTEGKNLIRYFCVPCKPTKANGERVRNLPMHDTEKWELFKSYNIRDVETEMEIQKKLSGFPVPDFIWDEYHLDQEINDRGIKVDREISQSAIRIDTSVRESITEEIKNITGIDNPGSVIQMKEWLKNTGFEMESLGKKEVEAAIKEAPGEAREVLKMRQKLSKSSVKKYQAMENAVCADDRLRGCFMFYGANRTGRFSGRLVQLQNLRRNDMADLNEARALVREENLEILDMLYEDIPETLSQLIRTAFIPEKGMRFYVADFSAIEARVIAWLADEKWRTELFESGGDIYCMSASQMFGVPVEKHGVNGHLRQKGKIAELACIAQGSLVLTDKGLIPIEDVTRDMKVWDGDEWVSHDGVAYKGEREVITYEGLTATADHLVWVNGLNEPVQFGLAACKKLQLVTSGFGIETQETRERRISKVYDIQNAGKNHRFTVSGRLVHNCGYGGSVGALKAMGALEMGLEEEELKPLVDSWRKSNPMIVKLWWSVDRAVKKAVKEKTTARTHGIIFTCRSGMLFITLPSGRSLCYVKPRKGENRFGGESITYEGIGPAKKWERIESYGPKFVENIVQAISRDILMNSMKTLRHMRIVAHVHDELIIEACPDVSLDEICKEMGRAPSWAEGLVLTADGYICDFYKKD